MPDIPEEFTIMLMIFNRRSNNTPTTEIYQVINDDQTNRMQYYCTEPDRWKKNPICFRKGGSTRSGL